MNSVENHNPQKLMRQRAVLPSTRKSRSNKNQKDTEIKDIRELDYLHKELDHDVKKTVGKTKRGFFARLWDGIKRFFGFGKNKTRQEVKGPKLFIDKPGPKSPYAPKVLISDAFIDMDFVEDNLDKYIFIFSGNLKSTGGKYGQSAILRLAKQEYPESVVELPVTRAHANVVDPETLREVSYRETNDAEVAENVKHIETAIDDAIKRSAMTGKTIFMLKGGYGTGGARMFAFAPKTFKAMNKLFESKLGVRNMLDPISAKYSLGYVEEVKVDLDDDQAPVEQGFSPEEVSKALWSNGWSLSQPLDLAA